VKTQDACRHFENLEWYCKVIRLLYITFLVNGTWYSKVNEHFNSTSSNKLIQTTNRKSYASFRLVPLLKFWWHWKTFESHCSLGCHFHVHCLRNYTNYHNCQQPFLHFIIAVSCGPVGVRWLKPPTFWQMHSWWYKKKSHQLTCMQMLVTRKYKYKYMRCLYEAVVCTKCVVCSFAG